MPDTISLIREDARGADPATHPAVRRYAIPAGKWDHLMTEPYGAQEDIARRALGIEPESYTPQFYSAEDAEAYRTGNGSVVLDHEKCPEWAHTFDVDPGDAHSMPQNHAGALFLCNDDMQPTFYCYATGWYHHAGKDAGPCFMIQEPGFDVPIPDGLRETPCATCAELGVTEYRHGTTPEPGVTEPWKDQEEGEPEAG
jgi:hypothetical protein